MTPLDSIREAVWQGRHACLRMAHRRALADYMPAVLEQQLRGRHINLVLDVGASRGQYARLVRRLGYDGEMVSFEPIPENVQLLRQQAVRRRGRWTIAPITLGDREETLPFQVMAATEFSSFSAPSAYGRDTFPAGLAVARIEQVAVRRLDAALSELVPGCADRVVHLKVDTQGYDMRVLRGLGALAGTVRSLQIEVAFRKIYSEETGYREALAEVEALGFHLTGLWPVARHASLHVIEADCLFVRG